MLVGFVASVLEFVFLQMMVIQVRWLVIGLLLMIIGMVVKSLARKKLVEAGFGSVKDTAYLQVVKGQQLVTDGLYRSIRHPIYTGAIIGMYGWVIMLSSLYGVLFVTIGFAGYLIRIGNEERMLVEAFGAVGNAEHSSVRVSIMWPQSKRSCRAGMQTVSRE
jgi:protein-S-isoprenylcysteine O-methyltransferase Ste14